jgi:undecaprenyl-diphosphatase
MSFLEAIILGIIQGLSEFIPISSTANLTIAGEMMGLIDRSHPERWTAFIATIQLGTLASVFLYFKKEIVDIPKSFLKDNLLERKKFALQSNDSKMGWYILLGSLPIVILGLALKDFVEGNITKDLNVIAGSLIGLGIILGIADKTAKFKKTIKDITWLDSLIVGFAQVLALIPGSSRSGTTITAGLFTGMNRETAARFSFLLSIPAILGSGLLSFYEAMEYLTKDQFLTLFVATLFSFISGYIAIAFLIKFLKTHSTFLFVFYRIGLGVLILLFY